MKSILIGLAAVVASAFVLQAQAEGTCVAQTGKEAHEGFCNNLTQQTCGVHSGMCTFEKAEVKTLRIIEGESTRVVKVNEEKSHQCVAKEGMQGQSAFCSKHNKQVCAVHTSVCEWE